MQISLATVTAEAVPYEDRVEFLAVLAKSISKSALYTSKKKEQNWEKYWIRIRSVWVGAFVAR